MPGLSRRELLQLAAGGAVGAAAGLIGLRSRPSGMDSPAYAAAPQGPVLPPLRTPSAPLSAHLGLAPNGKPYNVLMMVSDEHNPRFLDAFSPWVGTPNLNRLASEGVRLDRCYATSPLCAPARMGLLTGLFPTETGVMGNGQALDPRFHTLAHTFSAAGYATAAIGKTHTNHPTATYGFDYWMNEDSDAFHLAARSARAAAVPLPVPADEAPLWDSIPDKRLRGAPIEGDRTPLSGIVLDYAGQWLKDRPADRPFFLYTSWSEPHWVWNLPRKFYGVHSPADVALPPLVPGDLDDAPLARATQLKNGWDRMSEAQHRLCLARYADSVSYSDWVVGQLLAMLDQHGLAENTIVLYTSDHGDMAGEKRLWLKQLMFDGAARVPMIVRMPGSLPKNTTSNALFSGADVLPTLAGLTGIKPASTVSGVDRSAALRGEAQPAEERIFSCISGRPTVRLPGQLMVRDARYKLVRYPDRSNTSITGETRELYDMQDDPDEVQNLAEGREQRSRVSDLVKAGDAWLLSRTLCPYPVIRVEGRKSEEGLPLGDEEGGTD